MKCFISLSFLFCCCSLQAQTDTLMYHFTNGDSVRSHNIGVVYKDKFTLLNLAGQLYDIRELDYVYNPVKDTKMTLKSSGSTGSIDVYRRDAVGKFADLYSIERVKLQNYPQRGKYSQTVMYFNNGNGLKKLNFNNAGAILLKHPDGQPYYDQAKKLNGLNVLLAGLGAATATYGIIRSAKGEQVGGVVAVLPLSLFGLILTGNKRKRALIEGFKVVNGIE